MRKFKYIMLEIIKIVFTFSIIIEGTGILISILTLILQDFNIIQSNKIVSNFLSNIFLKQSVGIIVSLLYLKTNSKSSKENSYKMCKIKPIKFNTILYIILFTIGVRITSSFTLDPLLTYLPSYKEVINYFSEKSFIKLIYVIIFAPIIEEIIFRGLIFNFLKKNLKLSTAILVQALVFGIFHGNLPQGIHSFIFGILFALVYFYTDSIYGSIIMHMFSNALAELCFPFLSIFFNNALMKVLYFLFGMAFLIFGALKLFIFKKFKSLNLNN